MMTPEQIAIVRAARGDTPRVEFAALLGCHPSAISHIEAGRNAYPNVLIAYYLHGRLTADQVLSIREIPHVRLMAERLSATPAPAA